MRIKVGAPVSGDDYFKKVRDIDNIWRLIEGDSNVLISAPRRVGKTSLMFYIKDNPKENHYVIYIITESIRNENDYFKSLVYAVIEKLEQKDNDKLIRILKNSTYYAKDLAKRIKSVGPNGVEFERGSKINYFDEFRNLIKSLDLEGSKLIIMVDEFPQTLENIKTNEGVENAIHFLCSNRVLRQDPEIAKKIQFIYTGSIGLESVVSGLNQSNLINDLEPMRVEALNEKEAKCFINELWNSKECELKEAAVTELINKVQWNIPFYYQIILLELTKLADEQGLYEIGADTIDLAIEKVLQRRNQWESWLTRLKKMYSNKSEFAFIKELLNHISEHGSAHANIIFDLAQGHEIEENYKNILQSLKYDGYINNTDDIKVYKYNSPLLRMWWYENVAN